MTKARVVITEFVCPPIPIRSFDWAATGEDYEPGDVVGHGETEIAAVEDYLNGIEEATR